MTKRSLYCLFLVFIPLVFISLLQSCNSSEKSDIIPSYGDFEYSEIDITQIQEYYASGELSVEKLVTAYLNRIEAIDFNGPQLNSVITINPDAIEIARKLDIELKNGKIRGPLHGIPVLLKDNIDTHDKMPTTAGSRALQNSYPPKDSHVANLLRQAGAVIIGKANLSEWANFRGRMSSSGWSGIGGQTKNPYDITRNPCGSSSGSGVSVSANLSVLAIGTETNGSIVCPSNNNGIVGIKPTVGLVSRTGIIPISFTQDTAGPMARTLTDAVICLNVLAEIDSADVKTLDPGRGIIPDYTDFLKRGALRGKRLGWYTASRGRHFKVDSLMLETVGKLKEMGAEIIEIDQISETGTGGSSFQVMLHEYKDGLNAYFKNLGPDAPIKSLDELIRFNESDSIELLHYDQHYLKLANQTEGMNSEKYRDELEKLTKGSRENGIDRVMAEFKLDAFIAPTGGPAWKTDLVNGDSFHVGSSSPAARAGYPNITIPMGSIDGLPVGISFFGKAWSEGSLIAIAYDFEQQTNARIVPRLEGH